MQNNDLDFLKKELENRTNKLNKNFFEPSDSNLLMSPLNLNSKNNSFLNSFKSLGSNNFNFQKRNNSMQNLKIKKNELSSKEGLFIEKFTISHNALLKIENNKENNQCDDNLELFYFQDSDDENEEEEEKNLDILNILKQNNKSQNNKNEIEIKNNFKKINEEFYE